MIENLLIRYLPGTSFGRVTSYFAATAIVGATTLAKLALGEILANFPVFLYFPAILIIALVFDRRSGYLATMLSALIAAVLFMQPIGSLSIGPRDALALLVFTIIGFVISTVIEALRNAIARLHEREAEIALMFEESAHRTKNDLAIISSALNLQINASADTAVRQALSAANARVLVVAKAQERLTVQKTSVLVDLAGYIGGLCQGLGDLLRDVRPIAVRVDCAQIQVPGQLAVHVGLIVNELVTNSLKYAFSAESEGLIDVAIFEEGEGLAIVVADNGRGFSGDEPSGLGSKLVRLLAKQHRGTVEREKIARGCQVRITLPHTGAASSRS